MKRISLLLFTIVIFTSQILAQKAKNFSILSPDGKINVRIELKDKIYYSLKMDEMEVLAPSAISLTLQNGTVLGREPRLKKSNAQQVNEVIKPLYGKRSEIIDQYNELKLELKGNYSLIARVYNEGFAYRFITDIKDELIVMAEEVNFNFTGDYNIWASRAGNGTFDHSYEMFYDHRRLSKLSDSLIMLPVLVDLENGAKIAITESGLEDYPGFHIKKSKQENALEAVFPKYPLKAAPGGHMNFGLVVQKRADFIAKTAGKRAFPWRVFKISYEDIELLDTDLVYKLSDPPTEDMDFSWVKPGKVAWDWWCALNFTGVDFKSGINTESYKYYIDFAARNGIEYINLDEGWSDQFDLLKLSDQIDLEEIVSYANSKNVGVILWCVHWPLDQQLEEAMEMFDKLGIKGLKIDFMDRDDQVMVNFYHRIAKTAAQHKLLVNFHGAFKPSGLHRKYPNVINREAVRGLEYNKFSVPHGTTPEHAVSIPFIRMVAGPMDYTPGAMTNTQKANFGVFFERPMSQGTRCQQLAMFVVYEAPLQMLSDSPTAYEAEPEVLDFIANVPVNWDETVALDGKVGDYVVIARKKEDTWYLGGMTDWTPRTLEIGFSFLGKGTFTAEIFKDGINADRYGNDYKKEEISVDNMKSIKVDLAPGGGLAMKIYPSK